MTLHGIKDRNSLLHPVGRLPVSWFKSYVIPGHYHDRADAGNCFDELKNQWGSGTATPPGASPPPGSWPTSWRWSTTGGTSACASTTRSTTGKPSAAAPCSYSHRQSQRPARERRPHRPRRNTHQQRVAPHPLHHGAMERGAVLDVAADPPPAALAGRKVAPRPARGRAPAAQRIKTRPSRSPTERTRTPPPKALNQRAHSPFQGDTFPTSRIRRESLRRVERKS